MRSMAGRRQFKSPPKATPSTLYPRGTAMADVPPLARGITWAEYVDLQLASRSPETTASALSETRSK